MIRRNGEPVTNRIASTGMRTPKGRRMTACATCSQRDRRTAPSSARSPRRRRKPRTDSAFTRGPSIPRTAGRKVSAKPTELTATIAPPIPIEVRAVALNHSSPDSPIATAMPENRTALPAVATAGKAVLFSGIAVAIGLSGLLWFKATALPSIGMGGAIVAVSSVGFALTFLPAVLGMLGPRVNALSVRGLLRRLGIRADDGAVRRSRWEQVAHAVMRRPFGVLIPVLAILFVTGSPFLRIIQGVPDASIYPAGVPS